MIYKLCMRYTFNPSDVEDNYIEVLTNMYKYIETYNPERSDTNMASYCNQTMRF